MTTREVFATGNDPFMGVTVSNCEHLNRNTNKNIYNETLNSITRRSTRYEFNGMHLHGAREEMDKN